MGKLLKFSESYRRTRPSISKLAEAGTATVVTTDEVANYREKDYTDKFGAFMREWVAFSEDCRCGHEHPISQLNEAFNVLTLSAVNYAGYLQREDGCQTTKLLHVRNVVALLSGCRAPLSRIEHNTAFYCDEMDRCFAQINELLLLMEKEFGLFLTKPLALPAPP